MPAKPITDYRAFRKEVAARQGSRRTLRYPICLDTSLYDEMEDLEEQRQSERLERYRDGAEDDAASPRSRHGELEVEDKIAAVAEKMSQATVVAVFVIPDQDAQASRDAAWDEIKVATGVDKHKRGIEVARDVIIDCFDHFEDSAGATIDGDSFGLKDLKELLPSLSSGLIFGLSTKINQRSAGEPELPFSVTQSLSRRASAAT